tara:strand:+ start:9885 stop:10112 length:228 start_codon:yes stop_codon:yes gene_type:complete
LSKSTDKPEKSTNTCIENGETCHWVIEPPNGPVSMGKCKKCGTQKEFKNSFEYNTWHGERPSKDKDNSKKNDSKE